LSIKKQAQDIESLEFELYERKLTLVAERAYLKGVADGQSKYDLPPLLTRSQFMDFAGIGETKCAELFNRQDFPVNREFGHPRVPRELLFEWIYANTNWVRANAPKAMRFNNAI